MTGKARRFTGQTERVEQNEPESTSDRAELARSACKSRATGANSDGAAFEMALRTMLNPERGSNHLQTNTCSERRAQFR